MLAQFSQSCRMGDIKGKQPRGDTDMLTQEIIAGAFTEMAIVFVIIAITPMLLCAVFTWWDMRKWTKRFEAEVVRLNAEALGRLQIPVK